MDQFAAGDAGLFARFERLLLADVVTVDLRLVGDVDEGQEFSADLRVELREYVKLGLGAYAERRVEDFAGEEQVVV
jgi:hypothetical protein